MTDKKIKQQILKGSALVDQDWEEALDWFESSSTQVTLDLLELFNANDPRNLIAAMRKDRNIATIVGHLGSICIRKLSQSSLEKRGTNER